MSTIAIEASLADLLAWRREAERKLARLEAEVADMQGVADVTTRVDAVPAVAFAAGTVPAAAPLPWAPAPAFAAATPAPVPVAPLVHAAVTPGATPHAAAAFPAASAPSSAPAEASVTHAPATHAAPVTHAAAFREVRPQYDLTMKPGETVDLPSGLDGGRRKKTMGMIAAFLIVAGMAAMVISALVSQR